MIALFIIDDQRYIILSYEKCIIAELFCSIQNIYINKIL